MKPGPRFLGKNLLILQELVVDIQPRDMGVKWVPFWVNSFYLPLSCFNRIMVVKLENVVGNFDDFEGDKDSTCCGESLRVRILIDILKPVRRDQNQLAWTDQWMLDPYVI